MAIPPQHTNRRFYHFTHIDNLPGLLATGLLAHSHPDFPATIQSIAEAGIQARRAHMGVTCGPQGVVHDYVPFYFGSKSLMLLGVINKKNIDQRDILYFEFPISILERDDAVFTDASANTAAAPNFYTDPADLQNLNWGEIDSLRWRCDTDELRHQRMAEALVHRHVPLSIASACVVWNEGTKTAVKELTDGIKGFPRIEFENKDRRHYYTKFMDKDESKRKQSLVAGPKSIASKYSAVCEYFEEHIGANAETATFRGPKDLLEALRENFENIQETAELVGLETVNKVHTETVDVHTQQVVETLLGLPEFQDLDRRQKGVIELAAYLHDIGKGPKSRWLDTTTGKYFQRNDPDHPVQSMEMIARIFTEEVKKIKLKDANLIAKLVCYHDLIGDVLGRGRHETQIVDVADDEEELKLLFMLGKADATTLGFDWDQEEADAMYDRTLGKIEAK